MAEQAVWHLKRLALAIPVRSVSASALRARACRLGPPFLLGLVGVFVGARVQPTQWHAQAAVLFNAPTNNTILWVDPAVAARSEAALARSPQVVARVVRAAGISGLTAADLLRHSDVRPALAGARTAPPNYMSYGAIRISVSYRPRAAAIRLATAYAHGFARFKIALQARAVRKGMAEIDAILRDMRARGKAGTGRYRDMVNSRRDDAILAAQFARHGQFAKGAKGATAWRPHVLRNGLVGGALGALVGIALAVGFAKRRGRGD